MRHLSVPRNQTQVWLERCRHENWLGDSGVIVLSDTHRGIPLTEHAPGAGDACWEGMACVDAEPNTRGPMHWREHLPAALQSLPESTWPSSFETQGDVLMLKIEDEAKPHAKAIAEAMLTHMDNVRIVCEDAGVTGDFRVRDLRPIAWKGEDSTTLTQVREHGFTVLVDPAEVYFSARLSQQRKETLDEMRRLRHQRGHALVVADPYAGVGPSLPLLLAERDLLQGYLVGDLNPKAVDLMKRNLQAWTGKQEGGLKPSTVVCRDARTWREDDGLSKQAHVVLVNLPHDSFEHLPDLFDLFVPEGLNLLRGWAIVDRTTVEGRVAQLEALVKQAGGQPSDTTVAEIKGFSTTKCFVVFQTLITWD
jgi:tRNA (guanine37-N1)-methyltransferase